MRVYYIFFTSLLIICCRNRTADNTGTAIQHYENLDNSKKYFLICTDPIAHSFHKDYSSSSEYCNGLKYCIYRGYDVIRLSEEEAKSERSDPCNHCYVYQSKVTNEEILINSTSSKNKVIQESKNPEVRIDINNSNINLNGYPGLESFLEELGVSFKDFQSFDVEFLHNCHSSIINIVIIKPFKIQADDDLDDEIVCLVEIYPSKIENDYCDIEAVFTCAYLLDKNISGWEVSDSLINYKEYGYKFDDNVIISELDQNGKNEIHITVIQYGTTSALTQLSVLNFYNLKFNKIWSPKFGVSMKKYDSYKKRYYFFGGDWASGEGRYDGHRYFVNVFEYRNNTFEEVGKYKTKFKYDGLNPDLVSILSDAFSK